MIRVWRATPQPYGFAEMVAVGLKAWGARRTVSGGGPAWRTRPGLAAGCGESASALGVERDVRGRSWVSPDVTSARRFVPTRGVVPTPQGPRRTAATSSVLQVCARRPGVAQDDPASTGAAVVAGQAVEATRAPPQQRRGLLVRPARAGRRRAPPPRRPGPQARWPSRLDGAPAAANSRRSRRRCRAEVAVRGERGEHPLPGGRRTGPVRPAARRTAARTAGGATSQPAPRVGVSELARRPRCDDDVRGRARRAAAAARRRSAVRRRSRPRHEKSRPAPGHERDPPLRRQPRAQRVLVRRRAEDRGQPRGQRVDDEPVAVDGHRQHRQPGRPQRLARPAGTRLLDRDPRAARARCGPARRPQRCPERWRARPGSAGRPRWRSRCATTAARKAGSPTGSGATSGGSSAAARQARRQAARSRTATQGVRHAGRPTPARPAPRGPGPPGRAPAGGTATTNVPAPRRPPPTPRRGAGRTPPPSPSGSRRASAASDRVDGNRSPTCSAPARAAVRSASAS